MSELTDKMFKNFCNNTKSEKITNQSQKFANANNVRSRQELYEKLEQIENRKY